MRLQVEAIAIAPTSRDCNFIEKLLQIISLKNGSLDRELSFLSTNRLRIRLAIDPERLSTRQDGREAGTVHSGSPLPLRFAQSKRLLTTLAVPATANPCRRGDGSAGEGNPFVVSEVTSIGHSWNPK